MIIRYEAALGLQLQGIERIGGVEKALPGGNTEEWQWKLDGNEGEISFRSSGYHQYTRKWPKHMGQQFSIEERGGFSLERPSTPS